MLGEEFWFGASGYLSIPIFWILFNSELRLHTSIIHFNEIIHLIEIIPWNDKMFQHEHLRCYRVLSINNIIAGKGRVGKGKVILHT